MPPEQYERKVLDTRSDLYSLGCCFYQALTGTYPFNGTTGMEVMQAHLNHTVRPIQELRADIPLWACNWVMWLINRYPDDRPASAREALSCFFQNDKETSPIMSRGAPQGKQSRLIIPAPISSVTGPVFTSPLTGAVQTLPIPTASLAEAATEDAALPAVPPRPQRSTMIKRIVLAVVSVALIGGLAGFLLRQSTSAEDRAIHAMAEVAAKPDVKDIRITQEQLQRVLKYVQQAKPDAYLAPAVSILIKAKAPDTSEYDTAIAEFITTAPLHDAVRRQLIQEIIPKRHQTKIVPTMLFFAAKAKTTAEAEAAFTSVRKNIREEHTEALLNIMALSDQKPLRQAAELEVEQIIAHSQNRDLLIPLITKAAESTTNSSYREDLNRLLARCHATGS
jgi:hypothetical protein